MNLAALLVAALLAPAAAFQAPALRIAVSDFIVAGDSNPQEIYSLLRRLGIKNVINVSRPR